MLLMKSIIYASIQQSCMHQNTTKFGNKSLRAFSANIWNTLPEYINSTTSLLEFKKFDQDQNANVVYAKKNETSS